jgi:hypothetical protein
MGDFEEFVDLNDNGVLEGGGPSSNQAKLTGQSIEEFLKRDFLKMGTYFDVLF